MTTKALVQIPGHQLPGNHRGQCVHAARSGPHAIRHARDVIFPPPPAPDIMPLASASRQDVLGSARCFAKSFAIPLEININA